MPADGAPRMIQSNLAANLRYLRQRRGLTQAGLAHLCGLPRSTVAHVETGTGNPTLIVLSRLAAACPLSAVPEGFAAGVAARPGRPGDRAEDSSRPDTRHGNRSDRAATRRA